MRRMRGVATTKFVVANATEKRGSLNSAGRTRNV
jgi:hypothetical protein